MARADHLHGQRTRVVRPRRGLSLLEAVAALAIIGATSATALGVVGAGVRATERAGRAHEAEALAEEVLARLTLADDDAVRALPDSLAGGQFPAPFDDYTWHAVVQANRSWPGLFDVRVEVTWPGGVQSLVTALHRPTAAARTGMP